MSVRDSLSRRWVDFSCKILPTAETQRLEKMAGSLALRAHNGVGAAMLQQSRIVGGMNKVMCGGSSNGLRTRVVANRQSGEWPGPMEALQWPLQCVKRSQTEVPPSLPPTTLTRGLKCPAFVLRSWGACRVLHTIMAGICLQRILGPATPPSGPARSE